MRVRMHVLIPHTRDAVSRTGRYMVLLISEILASRLSIDKNACRFVPEDPTGERAGTLLGNLDNLGGRACAY